MDLQKDILDHMDFVPVIPDDLRFMDPRLFRDQPMGLNPTAVEKAEPEYEFWRDLRPNAEKEN